MVKDLLAAIRSQGNRGAIVPFSRVDDLKKDMLDLKNGDFHTKWLDRMANYITDSSNKFIPADIGFEPRSLISVVIPGPKVILRFDYQGKSFDCVVPPHYTNWDISTKRVLQCINDYLAPSGHTAIRVVAFTQKLLAVHCGLGWYGRNNICYNDEFGSYIMIMTYFSSLPCEEAEWYPLRRMKMCEKCGACVTACPTGAIDKSRRLINSDRCITLANECPGEFPDWLDPKAHNSITGCTKCQDCCPANAHNEDNAVQGVAFTEEETLGILNHKDGMVYSGALGSKLEETGIAPEFIANFPRNLSVLLQATPGTNS